MFHQVTQEGNLEREQKEDDSLRHCWGQVRMIDGIDQHPEQQLPDTYFMVSNGLLYYWTECRGQPCDLLVVPCSKMQSLMHLAHSHPLGGHVKPHITLAKL